MAWFIYFGRGSRNRTHPNGFGDRCTTNILYPYLLPIYNSIRGAAFQPQNDFSYEYICVVFRLSKIKPINNPITKILTHERPIDASGSLSL